MSQNHDTTKSDMEIECEKHEMMLRDKTELLAHVEGKHCSCTSNSVCDDCINYWVHKSQ